MNDPRYEYALKALYALHTVAAEAILVELRPYHYRACDDLACVADGLDVAADALRGCLRLETQGEQP